MVPTMLWSRLHQFGDKLYQTWYACHRNLFWSCALWSTSFARRTEALKRTLQRRVDAALQWGRTTLLKGKMGNGVAIGVGDEQNNLRHAFPID